MRPRTGKQKNPNKPSSQLGLTLSKPGRPRKNIFKDTKHTRSYLHRELHTSASVFLNDAQAEKKLANEERVRMYARAAIISAWSSLEAEVNGRLEQIKTKSMVLHELGLIEEKRVELRNGEFKLDGRITVRLEDKVKFLFRKYGSKAPDKLLWQRFQQSRDLRNAIVHAKGEMGDKDVVTIENAGYVISAVDSMVDQLQYSHEEWLRRSRTRLRS